VRISRRRTKISEEKRRRTVDTIKLDKFPHAGMLILWHVVAVAEYIKAVP
jgi:hypothetical protein